MVCSVMLKSASFVVNMNRISINVDEIWFIVDELWFVVDEFQKVFFLGLEAH